MPAMAPAVIEEMLCTLLDAVELAADLLGEAKGELVVLVFMVVEGQ
jgi:hypothetical protein